MPLTLLPSCRCKNMMEIKDSTKLIVQKYSHKWLFQEGTKALPTMTFSGEHHNPRQDHNAMLLQLKREVNVYVNVNKGYSKYYLIHLKQRTIPSHYKQHRRAGITVWVGCKDKDPYQESHEVQQSRFLSLLHLHLPHLHLSFSFLFHFLLEK